jgi:hypothetical protein
VGTRTQVWARLCVQFTRLGLFLAILPCTAIAQGNSYQTWPEIDAFFKVNSYIRASFFAATTREHRQGEDADIGPNIDFFVKPLRKAKRFTFFQLDQSKDRLLMLRVGYRYMPSTSSPVEYRGIVEATARYPLVSGVLVSDRNRADLRLIDHEFSWRYRNRLTAEREYSIFSYHFTPYLRAEAYYDSRYGKFSRTTETIGAPFPIHKRLEIEPYYEHQNDTSSPPNRQVNALGAVLSLYF